MSQRISDITGGEIGPSPKVVVKDLDSSTSEIFLKPVGLNGGVVASAGFATFWLGFITVWTFFAAQGSLLFAAFSIPFWFVGFAMVLGVFTSLFGKQRIEVTRTELVIHKILPILSRKTVIPYRDLKAIEMVAHAGRSKNMKTSMKLAASGSADSGVFSQTPTISYGDGNEYMFGEHLSERDKEWLVDYLNDKIVPFMKFIR